MELEKQRDEELKTKRICRFCLTQEEPLSNIYSRDNRIKSTLPLTLQIMACVSIEVFSNDGMPSTICDACRLLMDHSYRFKQVCKNADTLLKTYLTTGKWPSKLELPTDFIKPRQSIPVAGGATLKRIATPTPLPQPPESKRPRVTILNDVKVSEPVTQESLIEPMVVLPYQQQSNKPKIIKLTAEDIKQMSQNRTNHKQQASVTLLKNEKEPNVTKKPPAKIINGNVEELKKLNVAVPPRILNRINPKVERHSEVAYLQPSGGSSLKIVTDAMDDSHAQETDPIKYASHIETNVYPCQQCDRSFPLKQLLDIHMTNHVRERNFTCDICDKKFFSKYDLAKHTLTHTGERPFQCIVCFASFSRSTLLYRHQKTHKDQPKFLCVYCEKTFLSEEELERHVANHEKRRPFHCKLCTKSFAYKQGLERHEMTHAKDLPFPCEYCDNTFLTAGKLARHLTAHAGERPYPCRLCPKSFMLSHHLTRHLRSHAGNGSYKCNDCDKVFNAQDDLIYHSAVHATESLTCPLCKEKFNDLDMVTDHIKSHTAGEQHACDYCDLLFTSSEKLDSHCQKEHLNVLCMERSVESTAPHLELKVEQDPNQQYIIEEIAIDANGSQTITTFVDGEEIKVECRSQTESARKSNRVVKSVNYSEKIKAEVLDNGEEENEIEQELFEDVELDEEYIQEENAESDDDDSDPLLAKGNKATTRIHNKEAPEETVEAKKLPTKAPAKKPLPQKEENKPKSAVNRKLDEFLKISKKQDKNSPLKKEALPETPKKNYQDVLKMLPKSVTIVKNSSKTQSNDTHEDANSSHNSDKSETEKDPEKAADAPIKSKIQTSTRTTIKKTPEAKKPAEPIKKSPEARKFIEMKKYPEPKPTSEATKKSPSTTKAIVATPSTSTAATAAAAESRKTPAAGDKKTKTFEMKIGDKMVKVQKVVMTKAEVAAMAKEGKIEMQGGTMILKQKVKRK